MEIQEAIDIRYEEIEGLQQKLTEDHYMNPEQEDELEELITKAIKFGELCAQRDAKAQVIPEGFEQAYSKIFSPIVKRPYPRLENGNYKYIEIDQGWKLWQAATAQAVPEGFVLVKKELPEQIAEKMAIDRIDKPRHENDPVWREIAEQSYKDQVKSKKWEFWRDYKAMIEAQEPAND